MPSPNPLPRLILMPAALLFAGSTALADPILTSWYTQNSTVYARVIQSGSLTNPVTTWPSSGVTNNNTGTAAQTLPVYADVQRIRYTATDVYINANGLASYTMGPWFTNNGGLFGFWPLSRDYQIRITRNPTAAATKTKHPGGMIGMMVNGVAIYDLGDAFSFNQTNTGTATATTVTGTDGMGATGDGFWSRDALAVEVVTFDPGFAHQPGNNGQYHYHAEPKALRYQLGDNMKATWNPTTNLNTYTEDPTQLHHSPILGWAYDGFPIYGPYGYGTANSPASPVRRMRTGFVLRNGQNGTQNLVSTGRITLPKWAAIAQGYTTAASTNPYALTPAQYGPSTTYQTTGPGGLTTYSPGRYTGDYDYLGDLTNPSTGALFIKGTDFDLDQYNGRLCVTPEFPAGTYAYFAAIDANGTTVFPHLLGKEYYGTPNAGNATTVPGTALQLYNGGPVTTETWKNGPSANSSGDLTLTWNSVEGGTYKIEASPDLKSWSTLQSSLPASANASQTSWTEPKSSQPANTQRRFYRLQRTGLATYDTLTGQSP